MKECEGETQQRTSCSEAILSDIFERFIVHLESFQMKHYLTRRSARKNDPKWRFAINHTRSPLNLLESHLQNFIFPPLNIHIGKIEIFFYVALTHVPQLLLQ